MNMFRGRMSWNGFEWRAVETENGYALTRKCQGCWIPGTGMWHGANHLVEDYITKDEIRAQVARVARLRSYGEDEAAKELESKGARFL